MMALIRRALRASILLPLLALAAAPAACAGPGTFVWYSQVPPEELATSHEVTIHPGDTLTIRVLGHEEMTLTKEKVRTDGRIAVPLIGEVEASGKRPASLRAEIEGRLKDYIVSPSVMVNVDESPLMTVALLGEVTKPGVYTFEPFTGLAQVLAAGGGITEYASRDRIFVVRQQPRPMRIRFTYDSVRRNEDHAATFPLRAGDVVVVE